MSADEHQVIADNIAIEILETGTVDIAYLQSDVGWFIEIGGGVLGTFATEQEARDRARVIVAASAKNAAENWAPVSPIQGDP